MITPLFIGVPLFVFVVFLLMRLPRHQRIPADHRHPAVRILCGVLCTSALIAVGIGTWHGTRPNDPTALQAVKIPTLPVPPLPKADPYDTVDITPAQLVGTMIIARDVGGTLVPLYAETQSIPLPKPGIAKQLTFVGIFQDTEYTVKIPTLDFRQWSNEPGKIQLFNGLHVEFRSQRGWSSSGGGSMTLDKPVVKEFSNRWNNTATNNPLSIVPTTSSSDLRMILHLTRATPADPLREISPADWLNTLPAESLLVEDHNNNSGQRDRFTADTPPGMRMLHYMGPASVLLLLAGLCGAQCFRRGQRAMAAVALLALMVMFAGALDLLVLQRRAAVMADSREEISTRVEALMHAQESFFHRARAMEQINNLAQDAGAPAVLRDAAHAASANP